METRAVLGRGLRSLIPDKKESGKGPKVVEISLALIVPNQHQPRLHFDPSELSQLATSIKEKGVLQPILVRKRTDDEGYELIAGERRFRACKQLGLMSIPAIIKDADEGESCELALIENLQRTDLNWIEKAVAYNRYMDEFHMTQEQLAQKLGMSRTSVTNTLRLLGLPADIQDKVKTGEITFSHAKVLLSLPSIQEQREAVEELLSEQLTAVELDDKIKERKGVQRVRRNKADQNPHVLAVEETLRETLGTKVSVQYKETTKKGSIVIEYYSLDDLQRLVDRIKEEGF